MPACALHEAALGLAQLPLALVAAAEALAPLHAGAPPRCQCEVLWALALPIGAAAIRALAHVLTKVGMEEIPDAYLAGLIGFVVSALVTFIIHKSRRKFPAISLKNPGTKWFVSASACFSLAVLSLNTALYHGQVIQVIPIVAASPIFTLLLSIGIFRQEVITKRIILVVFMVVPAVMLIATA